MKKELKQILLICLFLIIGCVLGYFVALNQMNQLSDPEYIAFWTSQNMSVPEPLGFTRSILSFATVYKGNIIKNLIMDCQSYTKYRPNETTGGIFVSWRRKEELPTGA